uniref:Uncharacterized protein n=1 Tax=Marseillevirus LCMAC102 TaxID=2506603 RepID=A0A481YVL4_9VIRU|nr:MAG: uncharacterized protein LCMAC102_03310 [Marseillevirus LCMAC102]
MPNATIPLGYLDEDNIRFVQDKIKQVLKREFKQDILFDRGSIIRLMERAILDRIEPVPKMNQRAVMYGTNEFRVHQLEVDKHLRFEAHYVESQRLYDPTVEVSRYDPQKVKLANRLGYPAVGGTTRFYFT